VKQSMSKNSVDLPCSLYYIILYYILLYIIYIIMAIPPTFSPALDYFFLRSFYQMFGDNS